MRCNETGAPLVVYVAPDFMTRIAFHFNRYSAAPRSGRATRAVGLISYGLAILQACSSSDAVAPVSPGNSTAVGQMAGTAIVGTALEAPVRLSVTGSDGRPLAGATVTWTTDDGGTVGAAQTTTDGSGVASVRWTLGTVAGLQRLTAKVAGLSPVVFNANAVADRAAHVRLSTDIVRISLLGDTAQFTTSVTDKYGNAILSPAVLTLESGSDALVASGSWFIARNRGTAFIQAVVDTAWSRLTVVVDPVTPVVTRVLPDTLVPGSPIVVEGTGFALLADAVDLNVAGAKAAITRVTESRIEAVLPSIYGCLATGPQPVSVTIAGSSGQLAAPFRTARRIVLARGESADILDAAQVRCTELVAPPDNTNAKYVVAVINTSVTAAASSGFELRGAGAGALAGQVATPRATVQMASTSAPTYARNTAALSQLAAEERQEAQHDDYLDSQRAINARYGSPAPSWQALAKMKGMNGVAPSVRAPVSLGDTVTMKALYGTCSSGRDIRARVVYAGTKSVVLEDIASPLAGTMDNEYRLIGDEYDRVQYPLMVAKVGDPLAMNDAMGGDGRVTMLFTRYVNDSLPGIAGYVSACNFYPKGTFPASNEDDVFYARVANPSETPADWRRSLRGTVIHESKHLASFATRFVDGTPFEESWLEESLGRVALELYSRTFTDGGTWKGNVGYQTSVRCEVYQCDDRPLMMWKHFSVLHQYMRGVDTLTPIGAAASGDVTFYASGWSLVRWAADQYASDEATWIKDMVRGGQLTGLSNLAQRTGRSAGEMLADWALANAVDDLAGFVPARRELTFPSWNVANVFAGLAGTYPEEFMVSPLRVRAMSFGSFSMQVPRLRAFSSSYFTFEGAQTGSQLLELRGENGVALPSASLRLAVVRVE